MIHTLFLRNLSLWSCLWQSTLFAVIGLLGAFIIRRRPARAYQLLLLTTVGAVIVPSLSITVKHLGIGVFVADTGSRMPSLDETVLSSGRDGSPAIFSEEINSQKATKPVIQPTERGSSHPLVIPWRKILLMAWTITTLALAARLLFAFVHGIRISRTSQPIEDPYIQEAIGQAKARLALRKPVRIRTSRAIRSPLIWCWRWTPVLLLPGGLQNSGSKTNWEAVFSHELAHWKRRDHITGLLAELAVCVLPWNPLLWVSKSLLIRLSEEACDDWVLASGHVGEDYADSLLDFKPQAQMAFLPAVVHSRRGVAWRVRRILGDACANPRAGIQWGLAVTILTLCMGLAVAFAQARPAAADEEPKPEGNPTKSLYKAATAGDVDRKSDETAAVNSDRPPTALLHDAVASGDIEQVRRLLSLGVDVDATDPDGCTALHTVAKWTPPTQILYLNYFNPEAMARLQKEARILEMATLLVAKGADVNARDKKGNTPLHYASEYEKKTVAELLVAKGADIHAKNHSGQTPLAVIGPARGGVGALLVAQGAEIPTIHIAAMLGDLPQVKEFLNQGVSIDAKAESWTALAHAARACQRDVAEFLIEKGADVDAEVLHMAGNAEIAELLIAKGADVNPQTGPPPLHTAAARSGPDVLKVLLAHGANIEWAAGNGQTPLSIAMTWQRVDNMLFLIANGANVNARDQWEQTPLHYAVRGGWKEVVEALIAHGAEVDARAGEGQTPLAYAATFGRPEIAAFLLEKGADPLAKDNSEKTPIDRALESNEKAVIQMFAAKGITTLPEIYLAAYVGDLATVKGFAEEGGSVDEHDESGKTPLAYAARGGNLEVVGFLADKGANVNAVDDQRMTPLHHATNCGDKAIVALLLAKGADVNADSEKGSALHVAIDTVGTLRPTEREPAKLAEQQAVIDLLLSKGAGINAWNKRLGTPLHLAVENVQEGLVQLLIAKGADVNAKGGEETKGGPPLHAAVFHPHGADVAEPLILEGADVNARNEDGATLLHLSAERAWRRPHAKLLLAHGAAVDARDNQGATALHYAARKGRKDMLELLLSHGADIDAEDNEGRTALALALENEQAEIANFLRGRGAKQ